MPQDWQHILVKKVTHRKLKVVSAEAGVSIRDIAEEAVNSWLEKRNKVIADARPSTQVAD